MREVLVNDDTLDQHGVFELAANLRFHLDQLKVDVPLLHIGYGEDGVDGDLGHLPVALVNNLRAESSHGRLDQWLQIVDIEREGLSSALEILDSAASGHLEAIGNANRVDTLVKKVLSLLQEGTSKN